MASRVDLTIGVRADTEQAKKDLHSLQQTLADLVTMKGQTDPLKNFKASTNEVRKELSGLYSELQQATNDKGVLNINKLAVMWKQSGKGIEYYREHLSKLGPEGEQAFFKLTTAIARAQEPVRELDGLLGKFTKGLMNTAMWTLQSNAIHAFQSALSGAFSYAERLNKGLTDIAIVSDLTGSKLADFAKTANQMARELSTSTNEVVSGALIYYQAGLSDEEVINRTETTIKLAQTSGESAEQISSYMTAIWNNFYDGSKSVEYYADAISYLGAVTAASNADIAEGLQSFAATAETVGLSFEYAASAMTVIRDVTQQSASTIGNSLKTIFARLSSIKSGGEEEGVDLTKYTAELAKYGVEVLDANGELKEMDQILDDLAKKWKNLSKTQQTSIAQTVGGVRQYNNLITLMDNYEQFQELVSGAKNSTGYLDKQSEIYAQSWEAATNRVKAAVERLYQVLINDKFIISLTNGFAKILEFIGAILEKSGGFKTLFPMLIAWISKGINDNLNTTNNRVKEILNNTIHFKQYSQMGKELRGEATQGQLTPNFAYDITNEDYQKELNSGYQKYFEYIKSLEDLRAHGAPDSILVEYELQAKQLLNILEEVHKKFKEIENAEAEAARGKTVAQSDYMEQQMGRSYDITTALANRDAFGVAISDINSHSKKSKILDAIQTEGNITDPILQQALENKYNEINATSTKSQIVEELYKVFDQYIQNKRDEIDAAYKQAVDDKLFEEKTSKNNKKKTKGEKEEETDGYSQKQIEALKEGKQATEDFQKAQEKLGEQTKKATDEAEAEGNQLAQNSRALEEVKTQTDGAVGAMQTHEKVLRDINNQWQMQIGYITSAASSIVALAGAFSSFFDSFKEFKEGNIGEGFKQMGSSALMAASQFGMLANTIGKSTALQNMITNLSSGTIGSAITDATTKMGGFATQTAIAGKAGEITFAQLAGGLGTIATYAAIVAGALALIWGLWRTISPTAQQQELEKAAENNAKKVNDLKTEYEELTKTISSLDEQIKNIDALDKSTLEWSNAVHDLNTEFKDLIKKYDLIAGKDFIIEDGHYEFTEEGRNRVAQQKQEEIQAAQNAAFASSMVAPMTDYLQNIEGLRGILRTTIGQYSPESLDAQLTERINSITSIDEALNLIDNELSEFDTESIKNELLAGAESLNLTDNVNEMYSAIVERIAMERPDLDYDTIQSIAQKILSTILNGITDSMNGGVDNKQFLDYLESQGYDITRMRQGHSSLFFRDPNTGELRTAAALRKEAAAYYAFNSEDGIVQNAINAETANIPIRKNDYDRGDSEFSKKEKENAEQYAIALEKIPKVREGLQALGETEKEVAEKAHELAVQYINFNKGLKDLKENYETYIPLLRKADKTSMDYVNTVGELRNDLSLMLDIDPKQLSDGFFESTEAINALEKAAKGGTEGVKGLIEVTELAAKDLLQQGFDSIDVPTDTLREKFDAAMSELTNSEQWQNLEIGAELKLEDAGFLDTLNAMLAEAYAIGDEAGEAMYNAIMGAMNSVQWEPSVEWTPTTMSASSSAAISGAVSLATMGGQGFNLADISDSINATATHTVDIPKIIGGKYRGAPGKKAAPSAPKGGGGGSKKKDKEKGTQRYHEITEQLGQTKHALEMLNQEEDRAYGQKKLDLIQEKIKLLEKEAKQYKELYDEAAGYYASDRDLLAKQYGAKFNKDGTIKNFQEWYDSFVDKYNSGAMDDDAWKKFEDAIKKYEESYKKMNEAEKSYQDLLNQVYDARLAAIEHKLSFLNKEIDEANKHIDFLIEQMSKDIYSLADAMAEMSRQAGNLLGKAKNYRDAIIDMFAGDNHKGVSKKMIKGFLSGTVTVDELIGAAGDLTDKEIDMLYEYSDALEEISKQLIELREKQFETLSKVIDNFNDKIERQSDIVSDAAAILQHYRNVVDIVGKDILGISDEMLKQLGRTAVEAAKKNLAIAKLQLDQNKDILNQMYDELKRLEASGASAEALRLMEEQIAAQEDRVREMSENWAAAWEDALQAAQTAFTDAVKIATDAFDKAVAGSMGNLDNLQDMYDKQNTMNDLYLPKYQQIYELNKLTRDVNNAIDNTDNIAGKERLLELQRDINDAMMEGAQVSEYDVGFMQRRLELEMARIALEEAQNAKNQVRMTRDSEGNWSYTYTADAQKMADAQQNYEDKLYELEKYNQDHIKDVQDMMLNLLAQYRDDIAGLNVTDEERAQMLQDYWEKLQGEYGVFMDKALNDGQFIVDTFGVYDHQLMTDFDDTILSMTSGYKTLEDFMKSFLDASQYMMDQTHDAYSDWDGDWHSIFDIAGVDAENFSGEVTDAMAEFGRVMESATTEAQKFAEELGEQFDEALKNLQTFVNDYDKEIQKLIDKNIKVVESIQAFIYEYDRLHADDDEKEKKPTTPTTPPDQGGGGSGGSGGGGPSGGTPTLTSTKESEPEDKIDSYFYTSAGAGAHNVYALWKSGKKTKVRSEPHSGWYTISSSSTGYTRHCGLCNWSEFVPYKGSGGSGGGSGPRPVYMMNDNGGLMNAWGPEGKFAMMHEKELVLNKHDTENMLKTVGFVRDLTQMISLNASVAGQGLGNLFLGGVNQGGGFLDQTVTIHAEFPNATNHTEIEEAFSNLIGLASQYAGRKK